MTTGPTKMAPAISVMADAIYVIASPGMNQRTRLADFVLAQNIQNDDMTVDYKSDNIFVTDHPALIWLRHGDRAVLDYAREAGIDYDPEGCCKDGRMNMKGITNGDNDHIQVIRHLLSQRPRSKRR